MLSDLQRTPTPDYVASFLSVFALMDYDPDGIAILSTYKYGSVSLASQNANLVTPKLIWIGISSDIIQLFAATGPQDEGRSHIPLTPRDRRLAIKMLDRPVYETKERFWREELQRMLMLNRKAEIQILGSADGLERYVNRALINFLDPSPPFLGIEEFLRGSPEVMSREEDASSVGLNPFATRPPVNQLEGLPAREPDEEQPPTDDNYPELSDVDSLFDDF